MAEESPRSGVTADDMSVLRLLLHTIKGISPVSTDELLAIPATDE